MGLILVVILVILLLGALPTWNYSRNFGYAPSGLLLVVIILVAIFILGPSLGGHHTLRW
jgi:hypothetical protein